MWWGWLPEVQTMPLLFGNSEGCDTPGNNPGSNKGKVNHLLKKYGLSFCMDGSPRITIERNLASTPRKFKTMWS